MKKLSFVKLSLDVWNYSSCLGKKDNIVNGTIVHTYLDIKRFYFFNLLKMDLFRFGFEPESNSNNNSIKVHQK